ncbi:CoA pyrophosphatase [Neptunicella marina]|uniref:CoA pyrophosphatase n=1 Tax=Neptunicella marina TaxID=2125989 RepID=A0A8J6IRI3_9ALTE|nr:CoA pyrophosphatase [Neptunicella marina]MBC3764442.1 CoA pyrophosphatase [Neptunicella marina]
MDKAQFLSRFVSQVAQQWQPEYPLKQQARQAAVLIPVIERDKLTLLFTKRAAHLKHHPGQISFPGGRAEPNDLSLKHTALRETQEEIGLDAQQINVIGQLPSFKTVSRYQVTPYVGLIKPPLTLQTDPGEVEDTFEVPLAYLINPQNHLVEHIQRNGQRFPVNLIQYRNQSIWGLTAAFILNLSAILNH